jgi:hypothetical protein
VVAVRVIECREGLPDSSTTFNGNGALGLITVLPVAGHDDGDLLVQFDQLRGLDGRQVRMPDAALLVILAARVTSQPSQRRDRQQLGLLPLGCFCSGLKSFLS